MVLRRQIFIFIVIVLVSIVGSYMMKSGHLPGFTTPSSHRPLLGTPPSSGCLNCHSNQSFSGHDIHTQIQCTRCHNGNDQSDQKALAHTDLISIPGQARLWRQTCGTTDCHPQSLDSIEHSVMMTNVRLKNVDKKMFHAAFPDEDDKQVTEWTHSHVKDQCSVCHLGNEKESIGPIKKGARNGGCLLCHLQEFSNSDPGKNRKGHPTLSLKVSSDSCFGCHNRSGRIATNYLGWQEISEEDLNTTDMKHHRQFHDSRHYLKQAADIHHVAGLECIDCHPHEQVMGRLNEAQVQGSMVTCQDCHLISQNEWVRWSQLENIDRRLLRGHWPNQDFLTTSFKKLKNSQRALINVQKSGEKVVLKGKIDSLTRPLPQVPLNCQRQQSLHQNQLSCQACHSSWVTTCITCHTQRDTQGIWREWSGDFQAHPPSLGWRGSNGTPEITTFAPGMILTVDKNLLSSEDEDLSQLRTTSPLLRFYAAVNPHTTQKNARTCESCHWSSQALGWGQGQLTYDRKNEIQFTPLYEPLKDHLPADAWMAFLKSPKVPFSLHEDQKPLNLTQQKKALTVGVCLKCHSWSSQKDIYENFTSNLKKLSRSCVLPKFP
ncbi:MAG: hypothetical protein KDD61_16570 [Bdellovibrionales bacterium]|nr:hypothetical protein [Bdellovibrionales bacterium]